MKIDRRSLGYQLFVPISAAIAIATISLLVLVYVLSIRLEREHHRVLVAGTAGEVERILRSAATELTDARLTDNPVVSEAQQKSILDAISLAWSRSAHDGVIAGSDGRILLTTLDPSESRRILSHSSDGYFFADGGAEPLFCYAKTFPLWGWRIITASQHTGSSLSQGELAFLMPLVALGSLLMAAGLYWVLRRKLHQPVAMMVAAAAQGVSLERSGITEFDRIGDAVNAALLRVRERTAALERELTEREKAETKARVGEEHVRRLLEFTAEGIYGVDTHGVCTFCNRSCLNMLGYEREEQLLGKDTHILFHHSYADGSHYPGDACNIYTAFRAGRGVHLQDEVFWRSDGSKFPVEYWSFPVFDGGHVTGAVVTFVDISERRRLEAQLVQAQKMEAIGQLAGGIAHDFNNLLTAIIGYSELARKGLSANDRARKYVDEVIASSGRAAELTRGLLAFSRKQIISPRPTDLNSIVVDMGRILRRVIGEHIDLKTTLVGKELVVLVDRSQVDQILLNLVTNARDAMPDGGILTVETGVLGADEVRSRVDADVPPGSYACLSVSDTGTGMDSHTQDRIFEPFFTTKEMGRGTGLGLAIVYGIVKQHNGFIAVESDVGRGTTFRIWFPLIGETVEEEIERPVAAMEEQGNGAVLLAEDDAAVRSMLKVALESHGYRVIEAKDGEEAVRAFQLHQENVCLVLLDVIMPGRNGREVWEEIRRLKPDVRTLFMSGYTDDIIHRQGIFDTGIDFVAKPVAIDDLLKKLREVLAR